MRLLELYKQISSDSNLFDKYTNLGIDKYGKMFFFKNTNYRYIKSFFENNYNDFKKIEGINRSDWERNSGYNQEQLKTATIRMTQSKLFYQKNRVFYRTEKGKLVEDIIKDENFSKEEKWILELILLLNSYFNNKVNYIQNKTKYVFENFISNGYSESEILDAIVSIITGDTSEYNYSNYSYLYMDTFYITKEVNFLSQFRVASEEEKHELYYYVHNNLLENNCRCIISKKYKRNPSGNYDLTMLIENAKILYVTRFINNNSGLSFEDFYKGLIDRYRKLYVSVDEEKLLNFIFTNEKIFKIIYYEVNNIDYLQTDSNYEDFEDDTENMDTKEKFDPTSTDSIKKSIRINNILKKKTYEISNYKCELEELEGCETHYFTSKKTNKNYLECHHFIPKQFENDFDTTIDVLDNYVALCPHCHRKIHLAKDREREYLIRYIYNKRKEGLNNLGLSITLEQIEEYYGIGKESILSEDSDEYIE